MSGGQLVDPLEDRSRRQRRPEGEDVVEAERIDFALDAGMREERLDLGGKQEVIAALRVKERSNAEAIAREKQRTRTRVPDRERPLAVELPHGVRAQFLVQVQDDFC